MPLKILTAWKAVPRGMKESDERRASGTGILPVDYWLAVWNAVPHADRLRGHFACHQSVINQTQDEKCHTMASQSGRLHEGSRARSGLTVQGRRRRE